jgi:hypothetical protein
LKYGGKDLMALKYKLGVGLFLFVTPLVTSSLVVASPSLAATLAKSEATFKVNNFSHNPLGVETFTDTLTDTIATNGQVTTNANANASFTADPLNPPTFAENSSVSTANGAGKNYFGLAQSIAAIIGYDFLVRDKERFSFDFLADLKLNTSIENPQFERASAAGEISFQLYNTNDRDNWILLDFFSISGKLKTPGGGDSFIANKSNSITTSKPLIDFLKKSYGGSEESARASVTGKYSRTFDSLTYLTLVEIKRNQAVVKTPESSGTFALLIFCLIGVGYRARNKVLASKLR